MEIMYSPNAYFSTHILNHIQNIFPEFSAALPNYRTGQEKLIEFLTAVTKELDHDDIYKQSLTAFISDLKNAKKPSPFNGT
jgi:hypothetical protein